MRTQAKQTQKTIDAAFIVNIRKIEQSEGYFFIRFSLARGVGPHELRFWWWLFKLNKKLNLC